MNLRKATNDDHPVMMEIVRQAQQSLKSLGIDQWQNGYPSPEIVDRDIREEHAYVLTDRSGQVVAMASVIYNDEPTYDRVYDGEWLSRGDFVVVHRMAVAGQCRQKGVASFLLEEIERMAIQQRISSFKVDTHEGNIPMRRTLEKHGFIYCGRILLADGNPRVAYEKLLSAIIRE